VSEEVSPIGRADGQTGAGKAAWLWRLLKHSALLRLAQKFGISRLLGLCLFAPLLALRVWDPAPLETLRLKTFDLYQLVEPRQPAIEPVVIVDVDEESLGEVGQWPWPRTTVARLLDQLRTAGVVATAFDMVFAEPDRSSPAAYADSLTGVAPEVKEALRSLPANDEVFARAIRNSRLVLGQAAYHRRRDGDDAASLPKVPLAVLGKDPKPYLFHFRGLVRNTPVVDAAASSRAVFSLVPERDGIVRRVPAFIVAEDRILPGLSVELLRIATGGSAFAIKTDDAGIRSFVVAGVEVPTDRNGRLWVHYAKTRPHLYVSAKDVLAGTVAPERLAGKLVLIGTSAAGLLDIKATPLQEDIPGVEVHAQVLEMILGSQLLLRPNYALGAELVVFAVVALSFIALVPVLGALLTMLLGAVVAGGLLVASWLLYTEEGILIDVAYPALGALAVFGLLVFINYLREEQLRAQVRSAFRQYLSPDLVDQLAKDPDLLVLGGVRRDMTVLFSDVRDFTSISESMQQQPQRLGRLMNRLLTPLSTQILDHQGTIDKYMGDAVMAFWNAPIPDEEHAYNACRAALGMRQEIDRLNAELAQEAEAGEGMAIRLDVGIGLNSGSCVVGNMGSEQRFDYTVMGDVVNLASRAEGQCKTYGAQVIIGQAAATEVGPRMTYVELDIVRVKGKSEPQRIFALLGPAELSEDEEVRRTIAGIGDLLTAYRGRYWEVALRVIEGLEGRSLERLNLPFFLGLYRQRIEDFQASPPPPDWDGVYTATTK
jgi:adenylate cyclase